jgi:hypothetical protein
MRRGASDGRAGLKTGGDVVKKKGSELGEG